MKFPRQPGRRQALVALAGMACGCALPAMAQQWPTRPIRFIVPLTPGAGVDNGARLLADRLREGLGQSVIVENKPGANGVIGTSHAAKAVPDGYTLLFAANAHVIVPLAATRLPYDADKDFIPVATLAYTPYLLLVNAGLGVNTLQQFIEYAKARPGELNFGSSGVAAGSHMAGEVFAAMTGLKMQHIPYKGGGQAMSELMGGQIQVSFNTVNASATHHKSGKVKALAVSGEQRSAAMPDVPTFAEAGLPQYNERAWLGVFAPAGTPKAVIDRLNTEVARVLGSPGIKDSFDALGLLPLQTTPEQFAAMLRKETETYRPVVKSANIRIEAN
jgi:tripartite-type tricarboxylate transporter receptor subunit TctC